MREGLNKISGILVILSAFSIPVSITAANICIFSAALLCLLSGHFSRYWPTVKYNPIVWGVLVFMLYALIAVTWSIGPWTDRLAAVHKYGKLLYFPFLLPLFMDKSLREKAIGAFLLAVFITVIISYLKYFNGWQIGKYSAPSFVFFSHIETSFLVAFGTYLLAFYGWRATGWTKLFCWLSVLLFTVQEFFINNGRTGWVAYVCLLLLFTIQHFHWKGLLIGLGAFLLLFVAFYNISSTFNRTFNQSVQNIREYESGHVETSLGYRLSFVDVSLQLIKNRPIFGYGAGGFQTAYYLTSGVPNWKHLRTPHNEYLMTTVQLGMVGLVLLLFIFYQQAHCSFYLGKSGLMAQALLISFLFSCAYNSFLYTSVSGHVYVFFSALFYADLYQIFIAKKQDEYNQEDIQISWWRRNFVRYSKSKCHLG